MRKHNLRQGDRKAETWALRTYVWLAQLDRVHLFDPNGLLGQYVTNIVPGRTCTNAVREFLYYVISNQPWKDRIRQLLDTERCS